MSKIAKKGEFSSKIDNIDSKYDSFIHFTVKFNSKVDRVCFLFFPGEEAASPLVSKEKEKLVPIFREKDEDLPASIWQKSRHWDARKASSFTGIVAIFTVYF